jgi:hypothetical protein
MAKEEFTGFANAPVDEDGKYLDFRDVEPFVDESDEGKALKARQETASSITAFHTDDKSTDGAPAAVVPDPDAKADPAGVEADADESQREGADEPGTQVKTDSPKTARAAGGKEVKGS